MTSISSSEPATRSQVLWRGAGRATARLLELKGGVAPKFGQLLSTRHDLLPQPFLSELTRLHEAVRPMTARAAEKVLADGLNGKRAHLQWLDPHPFASGCIAQAHRATVAGTGQKIVLKVKRYGVAASLARDFRIARYAARLLQTLPPLRTLPISQALEMVGACIDAQADLVAEARHQLKAREYLSEAGLATVPRLFPELCGPDLIAMEEVPDTVGLGEAHGSAHVEAGRMAVRALFALMFDAGLVHCDLHPGNARVSSGGELVIFDFGFAYVLEPDVRRRFAEFFLTIILGDGARAAHIVREMALALPESLNSRRFDADIATVVRSVSGRTARDFSVARFVAELFAIQRAHGVYASPAFAAAIIGLLTLEGTIKHAAPDLEFQREALPYILRGASL